MLGYYYVARSKKSDRFYAQVMDNLDTSSSPMFHELRIIWSKRNTIETCETLILEFFKKYLSVDTSVYKLANKSAIDYFYESADAFENFQNNRLQMNWAEFWSKFDCLKTSIDEEYWANVSVLYREYRWMRQNIQGNYLLRLYNELVILSYQTVKFLVILGLLLIYFTLYFHFVGHPKIFSWLGISFKDALLVTVGVDILLFCLLLLLGMLTSNYTFLTNFRKSKTKEFLFRTKGFKIPNPANSLNRLVDKIIPEYVPKDIPPMPNRCDESEDRNAKGSDL